MSPSVPNEPPPEQQGPPPGQRPQRASRSQRTSRSRMTLATAAIRPGMKGRIMLSGPAGAGKTYTSLLIASVLVGPEGRVCLIDTEKDSARTYADEFDFFHLPWQEPFDATDLALSVRDARDKGFDAVIVDSFSHFWRGQGGILDTASGRWTGWKEARPMHADVIDAVLTSDVHVILCCRSKMEHVQIKDERSGKLEVRKLGMKAQQDDDLEYEVNIAVEMDMAHVMHVSKSRTRAIDVGREFISGHAEQFAGIYRDWLGGGEPVAAKSDTDALVEALNRIEDPADRQAAKMGFLDAFGRPEFLLVSRLPDAQGWVADRLLGVPEPPDRAPDATPPAEETHEEGETPPVASPVASESPRPSDTAAPPSEAATGEPDEAAAILAEATAVVGALDNVAVTRQLTLRDKKPTGTAKRFRVQLIELFADIAAGAAFDPLACEKCGGYTEGPYPPRRGACECAVA